MAAIAAVLIAFCTGFGIVVAVPAAHAGMIIIGSCNYWQRGEIRIFGSTPYQCQWVPGLGGWYWVGYRNYFCKPALATGPAKHVDSASCV